MHPRIRCVTIYCLVQLLLSATVGSSSLESNPPQVNGVLIAYDGDQISLTCSHNNLGTGVTKWSFTSPVDCIEAIDHNPPITTRSCGPFTFERITELSGSVLNSTAVATASASMNGAVVECRDSAGVSFNLIGNITLCIIG